MSKGGKLLSLFQTQTFETHYWVLSVSSKASLLWEFAHDMVSDGGEGIQISVSESPGETQAKPIPRVIRFPHAPSVLLDHTI